MAEFYKLFNLVVSHEPWPPARREALRIVRDILGGSRVQLFASPPSLLLLKVPDPFEAVEVLRRELDASTPILRVVPLDGETSPFVEDVAEIAGRLVEEKRGGGRPSFAVRLEGYLYRRSDGARLHKDEAIRIIAEQIDLPVNLSSPELLVLIRVVRVARGQRYAGLMVAPPTAILSRAKLAKA